MAETIDLNGDLGESFGPYTFGADDELLPLLSSANLACGFHAGDPRVMERSVNAAAAKGIAIGAHVAFPDRVGFGRRELRASREEIRSDVLYQIGALHAFCRVLGVELQHVKPHGALYHLAAREREVAEAVVEAVAALDRNLILFAPPQSELALAGERAGIPVAREGFADRNIHADGKLVSRRRADALVKDPQQAAERVLRIVREGKIRSLEGEDVSVSVETICLHGDTPGAVALARAVRDRLEAGGVRVRPIGETLRGKQSP